MIHNWRPDIIIAHDGKSDPANRKNDLTIVELSCPFEWKKGFIDVHKRKTDKYQIPMNVVNNFNETKVKLICVEVGSRGLISKNTLKLRRLLNIGPKELRSFLISLGRTSLLESINIYKQRNTMPILLTA